MAACVAAVVASSVAVCVAACVAAGVAASVAVCVAACVAAGVPASVAVWLAACVAAGLQACVAAKAHGARSPTIAGDDSGMEFAVGASGDSMDAADVWDQSEGSADEAMAAVLSVAASAVLLRRVGDAARRGVVRPKRRLGSVVGRRSNRDRDFDAGNHAILRDYFGINGRPPAYGEGDFERRFRVPRQVFEKFYNAVKDRPFWARTINATGRPQAHALQKVVAAFRVLAYGES